MKSLLRKLSRTFTLALFALTIFPQKVLGAGEPCGTVEGGGTGVSLELNEPLGDCAKIQSDTAIGFLLQYVKIMYVYGAGIVGIICVLVIAVSGMQYAMDSESAEEAKKRIINSLTGLAVLFLSALFLYVINPNFFTLE